MDGQLAVYADHPHEVKVGVGGHWEPVAGGTSFVSVVQTASGANEKTYADLKNDPWSAYPPGIPIVIKWLDNGKIPAVLTTSGLAGKSAQIGDWIVPVDTSGNGTSDTFRIHHWREEQGPNVTFSATAGQTPL
jgi:hypothetical protein